MFVTNAYLGTNEDRESSFSHPDTCLVGKEDGPHLAYMAVEAMGMVWLHSSPLCMTPDTDSKHPPVNSSGYGY